MKVVIAPDSYKGCLSSSEVAAVAARSVRDLYPDAEVVELAVADGGEGTVEALVDSLGGRYASAYVSDPLGRRICARYGIAHPYANATDSDDGQIAIIEVATACGLTLLSASERNPLITSTRGVGELILDAIERGCRKFLIGLGGSATNDGGYGMATTPGLLDAARGLDFTVACDVDTPFIGPAGASRVFAPQKGADAQMVEILEQRLCRYAEEILSKTGVDVRDMPGAGAAGGLGGAFKAFFGASLRSGVDMVLDAIGFDNRLSGADLVITGEGRSDFQTAKGKTPMGVLTRASRQRIPTALVSGAVLDCPELRAMGFCNIVAATPAGMPLTEAMKPETARQNIYEAVRCMLSST